MLSKCIPQFLCKMVRRSCRRRQRLMMGLRVVDLTSCRDRDLVTLVKDTLIKMTATMAITMAGSLSVAAVQHSIAGICYLGQ